MRPTCTPVARVRTAERAGHSGRSQDRVFTAPDGVIVLDGASHPEPGVRDGGWYAETLGRELHPLVSEPGLDLAEALARAIDAVATRHDLRPGVSPSSTVSILRWDTARVDVLVLGDSPVVALTRDGVIHQVRDDRLAHVGREQRRRLRASPGYAKNRPDLWKSLVETERAARNQPGGYWIAEATPAAATHAHRAVWHRAELVAVLVMTDGVSAGVDRYGTPPDWRTAVDIARDDPERLVKLVHDAEADDPDRTRWPRSKPHDDKALALVEFT